MPPRVVYLDLIERLVTDYEGSVPAGEVIAEVATIARRLEAAGLGAAATAEVERLARARLDERAAYGPELR